MDLSAFAIEVINTSGGAAEACVDSTVHALLPEDLATRLGLPPEVHLTTGPGATNDETGRNQIGSDQIVHPLAHGSVLLDRLVEAAIADGRVAAVTVDMPAPSPRAAEAAVHKALQPLNGAMRLVASSVETATYLVLGYHYCAAGEERREGLCEVAVDLSGFAASPTLPKALAGCDQIACEVSPPQLPVGPADHVTISDRVLKAATGLARSATEVALRPVYRVLENRLSRDVARMHGYFGAMQQEILRAGTKRSRDAEAEAKLLARLNGIPREYQQRVQEARTRLSLRVTLAPVTAVLVAMPAVAVSLRLLRRKNERQVTLHYGALQRRIDLPVCEGCSGHTIPAPLLCDDAVHLLCTSCLLDCPNCGARTCLACGARCRRCKGLLDPARARIPSPTTESPPASAGGSVLVRFDREGRAAQVHSSPPPPPPPTTRDADMRTPRAAGDGSRARGGMGAAHAGSASSAARKASPRTRPAQVERQGRRALAAIERQLGASLDTASAVTRVRNALAELGRARSGRIADAAGLPIDVTRQALQQLQRRGEIARSGTGRGTEYQLA